MPSVSYMGFPMMQPSKDGGAKEMDNTEKGNGATFAGLLSKAARSTEDNEELRLREAGDLQFTGAGNRLQASEFFEEEKAAVAETVSTLPLPLETLDRGDQVDAPLGILLGSEASISVEALQTQQIVREPADFSETVPAGIPIDLRILPDVASTEMTVQDIAMMDVSASGLSVPSNADETLQAPTDISVITPPDNSAPSLNIEDTLDLDRHFHDSLKSDTVDHFNTEIELTLENRATNQAVKNEQSIGSARDPKMDAIIPAVAESLTSAVTKNTPPLTTHSTPLSVQPITNLEIVQNKDNAPLLEIMDAPNLDVSAATDTADQIDAALGMQIEMSTNGESQPTDLITASNLTATSSVTGTSATQPQPLLQLTSPQTPVVMAEIPEIIADSLSRIKAKEDGIVVQLDPPELGRVSIDFKFDDNGVASVTITGDTPEALRQLRNMHSQLLQAIEDQGLRSGDLNYNQRQQGEDSRNRWTGAQEREHPQNRKDQSQATPAPQTRIHQKPNASANIDSLDLRL